MTTPTYLFYDLETTGLNPCFDQVLQFAAIRTDMALNEIDRHEIHVKINPDIIPSPYAVITHRISWQDMCAGINEYEAVQQIHQLLNTPGTISVGYNTLGFDDEFLRFNFYKHLLPPYTHQFANGCGRMDLLPITLFYHLYQPDIIQWPTIDDHVSLKLDALNALNQWTSGMSHTAIVDVEATVELARALHRDNVMWTYLVDFFNKETDLSRMNQLTTGIHHLNQHYPQALMTHLRCGRANDYQMPVLGLGQHRHYKNQTLWLRLDDERLSQSTSDSFLETTRVLRKKPAEPPLLLPTKDRFIQRLSDERQQLMTRNLQWLQQHPEILQAIERHYQEDTYPEVDGIDPEAALYQVGFASRDEETLFQTFHQTPVEKKWAVAQRFPNPIRQQLAMRILARHYPQHLPIEQQETWHAELKQPKHDFRHQPKYDHRQAQQDLDELSQKTSLDPQQIALVKQYQEQLLHHQNKALARIK